MRSKPLMRPYWVSSPAGTTVSFQYWMVLASPAVDADFGCQLFDQAAAMTVPSATASSMVVASQARQFSRLLSAHTA